ncbi:isochorismate synthase [Salinibacillus xinjiangensis]|uniref:Isochorismate synthase MenF n=1 Tax=Salinibacillus xinjiangensis TaxID=1229268 RepID=A0A6G1X303_9BACI|nr:isochorismate synthase [Salinibacillus xinjiangensis]MRG85208.1 isochorismate synthase [Salinibacillus xinjiangensis]
MIETKQQWFLESISKAMSKWTTHQEHQLFSYTEKIHLQDPLAVFQMTESFKGSRIFWTSPEEDVTFIGFGSALTIDTESDMNQDRFERVERKWKTIVESSYIDNPYKLPGTGPVLMGGFSFDLTKNKPLWKNFPNTLMWVPEFLVVIQGEEAYLTFNVMLKSEEQVESKIKHFENTKETISKPGTFYYHKEFSYQEKWDISPEEWKNTVLKATEQISQGKMDKVVLARELRARFNEDIPVSAVLANLLEQQGQSYVFAIESGEDCFIGATPERLVKVEDDQLLSTCLAGTAPRGDTPSEDENLGAELINDEKNLMEHQFVVNMIKEAVEASCDDVEVPSAPVLYRLRNLQHLYTPVQGKLKAGHTLLEVVKRLHPTPAMGGVPRDKALQFIYEEERLTRGWYSAPIGWMDAMRNGEFAVAIRSGLIQKDEVSLFAGCGIVKDSDPEKEFIETKIKYKPMLMALGGTS